MKQDKYTSKIIMLIGMIFTVYGLILCLKSNLNLGVVLVAVLGVFAFVLGLFYEKVKEIASSGFFKWCKIIVVVLLCVEAILVSFIAVYGTVDNVDYTEEAVIVLGAGVRGERVTLPLKMRLDKAIEFHNKNPKALIVVTGGKGFQETVTEAYAMEKYLLENGVSESVIIKEEQAVSTYENMKFSKELLDEKLGGNYAVVVITNNFHIFRGTTVAKRAGFEKVSHFHAGLQWYNLVPCYLRESLAVLKLLIFG